MLSVCHLSSHLISSQLCLLLTRAPHPRKSCQSSSHPTSTAFPHSCLFFLSPHINSHVTVCKTSTINHLYHSTQGRLNQHRDFVQPPILMQTPFPMLVQRRDGSSLSKTTFATTHYQNVVSTPPTTTPRPSATSTNNRGAISTSYGTDKSQRLSMKNTQRKEMMMFNT